MRVPESCAWLTRTFGSCPNHAALAGAIRAATLGSAKSVTYYVLHTVHTEHAYLLIVRVAAQHMVVVSFARVARDAHFVPHLEISPGRGLTLRSLWHRSRPPKTHDFPFAGILYQSAVVLVEPHDRKSKINRIFKAKFNTTHGIWFLYCLRDKSPFRYRTTRARAKHMWSKFTTIYSQRTQQSCVVANKSQR